MPVNGQAAAPRRSSQSWNNRHFRPISMSSVAQPFFDKGLTSIAMAITAFVVGAASYLWYLEPSRWRPFLAAMAVVCAAWGFRQMASRRWKADDDSDAKRRKFTQAIVVGTAMMAYPLGRLLLLHCGWLAS
jgi:hypothetical protein